MAGIVGAYEDGVLVDLVATSLDTRAMRTRLGIARLLGEETIERARRLDRPVLIFNDPLAWLCSHCCGVVIVDWRCAPFRLADVPGLVCQSEMLARRLKRAFDNPQPLPPLFVPQPHPQETHHAA